jgi:hypothetical protein
MAVRTEVVSFHSCDLCEEDRNEADLTRLYGAPRAGKRPQIDICPECQQRPISEVVGWLRRKQPASQATPLRGIRGTLTSPSARTGRSPSTR